MPAAADLDAWAARLVKDGVAGPHRSHSHHNNMGKLRRTLEGDPTCTFGVKDLHLMSYDEALLVVADVCGWKMEEPTDYVDPLRTLGGAVEAGRACRDLATAGGEVIVATGHPDTLIPFVGGISELLEAAGMTIRRDCDGTTVNAGFRARTIEYEKGVAVLADDWGAIHTHSPEGMLTLLAAGPPPDLVVADHGWAGAAMEAGIFTVATLDTNDPALALAKAKGAPGILIPLDDGRPPLMYEPVLEAFRAGFDGA